MTKTLAVILNCNLPTYCRLAEDGQRKFIKKMGIESDFHRIRSLGENYKT